MGFKLTSFSIFTSSSTRDCVDLKELEGLSHCDIINEGDVHIPEVCAQDAENKILSIWCGPAQRADLYRLGRQRYWRGQVLWGAVLSRARVRKIQASKRSRFPRTDASEAESPVPW